jgi:hypothetical protein
MSRRQTLVLFRLSPNAGISIAVDFDVKDIGPATDWTVFDVFLDGTLRQVDRHYDFLATGIADVAGVVHHLHRLRARYCCPKCQQ